MQLSDAELVYWAFLEFLAFLFAMTCVILGRLPKRKRKKRPNEDNTNDGMNRFILVQSWQLIPFASFGNLLPKFVL